MIPGENGKNWTNSVTAIKKCLVLLGYCNMTQSAGLILNLDEEHF